jgi:hypothetical protein
MAKDTIYRGYQDGDKEQIINMLAKKSSRSDRYKKLKSQLWDWQYQRNPHQKDPVPTFVICEKNDRVIGAMGFMPNPIIINGSEIDHKWGLDFIVDEKMRGRIFAIKIVKIGIQANPVSCGFNVAPLAYKILLKLGLKPIETVHEMAFAMRPPKLTGRELSKYGYCHARWYMNMPTRSIIEIKTFHEQLPGEVEQLWKKIAEGKQFIFKHDIEYLNWKYFKHPFLNYSAIAAYEKNEIKGILIYRITENREVNWGHVVEFMVGEDNPAVIKRLVQHFLRLTKKEKVHYISFVNCHSGILKILKRIGFFSRRYPMRFAILNNLGPQMDILLNEPHRWYISGGDSDNDFAP